MLYRLILFTLLLLGTNTLDAKEVNYLEYPSENKITLGFDGIDDACKWAEKIDTTSVNAKGDTSAESEELRQMRLTAESFIKVIVSILGYLVLLLFLSLLANILYKVVPYFYKKK